MVRTYSKLREIFVSRIFIKSYKKTPKLQKPKMTFLFLLNHETHRTQSPLFSLAIYFLPTIVRSLEREGKEHVKRC